MNSEPSRLVAAITAAITATIGLFVIVGVFSDKVGGALTIVAGAWVVVAGEIVRARVTPNDRVAAIRPESPSPFVAGGPVGTEIGTVTTTLAPPQKPSSSPPPASPSA